MNSATGLQNTAVWLHVPMYVVFWKHEKLVRNATNLSTTVFAFSPGSGF